MTADMAAAPRAELRLVAGFALMPLVAAVFVFIAFAVLWSFTDSAAIGARLRDPIGSAVSMGMAAGLVGVFVTVLGAVPALVWLLHRGPISFAHVMIAGAAFGNLPFAVGVILMLASSMTRGTMPPHVGDLWYGIQGALQTIGVGLFSGMSSAAVFWLVALEGSELVRTDATTGG